MAHVPFDKGFTANNNISRTTQKESLPLCAVRLRLLPHTRHCLFLLISPPRTTNRCCSVHLGLRRRDDLAAENRELRQALLELRRRELRMEGLEQEIDGLARTLAFQRRHSTSLRIAEVVHADYSSWLRSLVLYVGTGAARRNQAVLSDDGLVGRVIRVSGAYAKVQLLTDRAASAGVQLQSSRRQGVVRGSSPGELLLDFIPRQAEVEVGETVLTAGIDGVYPRGIRVGVVASVEPGSEVFHRIVVKPAVDFSRLSFVYLLEGEGVPAELLSEGGDAVP